MLFCSDLHKLGQPDRVSDLLKPRCKQSKFFEIHIIVDILLQLQAHSDDSLLLSWQLVTIFIISICQYSSACCGM
jgi:hypothetical protein